jgi:hypothetical protein
MHIEAGRLNVAKLNVFVLGGVVHEGGTRAIDIQPLREAISRILLLVLLDQNANE